MYAIQVRKAHCNFDIIIHNLFKCVLGYTIFFISVHTIGHFSKNELFQDTSHNYVTKSLWILARPGLAK